MLRGTEGERKNNTRSQGEEGTIWPGYFLRSPEGDEPNISFWVLGDAELTYSSLKAAQLSVFRLFVSSSLSSSCPFHHFFAYFFILDFGSTLFFLNMADVPCRGQNKFYMKKRVTTQSHFFLVLTSISVVIQWRDHCIFLKKNVLQKPNATK